MGNPPKVRSKINRISVWINNHNKFIQRKNNKQINVHEKPEDDVQNAVHSN